MKKSLTDQLEIRTMMMDSTLGRSVDGHHVTEVSTFSSPLDHVLRHVPKSHEKALRQAVYNVLAAAVLIIVSFAAYYAFQVQPTLRNTICTSKLPMKTTRLSKGTFVFKNSEYQKVYLVWSLITSLCLFIRLF